MSELVVLGNGFDLNVGLKSSFSDFFQWLKDTEQPENANVWCAILEDNQNKKLENWADIESLIANIVIEGEPSILLFSSKLLTKRVLNDIDDRSFFYVDEITIDKENSLYQLYEYLVSSSGTINDAAQNFVTNYPTKDIFFTRTAETIVEHFMQHTNNSTYSSFLEGVINCIRGKADTGVPFLFFEKSQMEEYLMVHLSDLFNSLLLNDLHEFENLFSEYLMEEIQTFEEYTERSAALLNKLKPDKSADTTILSFNYTDPFSDAIANPQAFGNKHPYNLMNVHGDLKFSKIIFGIDSMNLFDENMQIKEEHVLPFTKTYRKMLGHPYVTQWHLPEHISSIIFYGHSLSDADYSYFQSIFDSLDLYQSNIKLYFLFANLEHSHDSLEKYREKQVNELFTLLTKYGKSLEMNNNNHGKNLVHKLLVENRLFTREESLTEINR